MNAESPSISLPGNSAAAMPCQDGRSSPEEKKAAPGYSGDRLPTENSQSALKTCPPNSARQSRPDPGAGRASLPENVQELLQ